MNQVFKLSIVACTSKGVGYINELRPFARFFALLAFSVIFCSFQIPHHAAFGFWLLFFPERVGINDCLSLV